MAFDGRLYSGAAFVAPIAHLPEAPATGDALSGALIAGYFYSRHHAKLIGTQTYPLWRRVRSIQPSFSAASWVDVAEFLNVPIPAHVDRLGAEVWCGLANSIQGVIVHHRILVDDGTTTNTGDDFSFELREDNSFYVPRGGGQFYSAYPEVAVTLTRPATCRVRVQAYAIGGGDVYAPILVTGYRWSST